MVELTVVESDVVAVGVLDEAVVLVVLVGDEVVEVRCMWSTCLRWCGLRLGLGIWV